MKRGNAGLTGTGGVALCFGGRCDTVRQVSEFRTQQNKKISEWQT